MRKIVTFCLYVFPAVLTTAYGSDSPASSSPSGLPGITRSTNQVFLIENHSTAFNIWHSRNIKGATLVHVDTHDDCRYIPPQKLMVLNKLAAGRNYDEVFKQSDMEFSFRYQLKEDKFLFDLGNFIYPCILDGTVSRLYWVIPDKTLSDTDRIQLKTHIQQALKLPTVRFIEDTERLFSFSFSNCVVTITLLDSLPTIIPGALLDIDTDFFVFPKFLSDSHTRGNLQWDLPTVCAFFSRRIPNPSVITISSSVAGGYLPVAFRFLSDALFEYFASGVYPRDAVDLLDTLAGMLASPTSSIPVPRKPDRPVFQTAFEHLTGLVLAARGQDDDAVLQIELAARLNPVYSKAMLDMADAFMSMGKLQRAHNMIDRFEKFTGCGTSQSDAMRVRIYLAERQMEKADALTRKLVEWDKAPYFLLLRGGILVEKGKLAEAMDIYHDIIRAHPDNASAYYNMGLVFSRQGNTAQAIENYRTALKLKPDLAIASENLGYLLSNEGKYSEAAVHLKAAVISNPFNVITLNNLGLSLAKQRIFADSISYYNAAIRLNPDLPEIHANLAAAFLGAGRPDECIEKCKQALKLKPDWPEVTNLMNEAERQKTEVRSQNPE